MILYLVVCAILLACIALLFLFFIRQMQSFKQRKWKNPISYFIPSIVAVLIVFLLLFSLSPRVLSLIEMARGKYDIEEINVSEIKNFSIITDTEERLYYSPWESELEEKTYVVYKAPNTSFVIEFHNVK